MTRNAIERTNPAGATATSIAPGSLLGPYRLIGQLGTGRVGRVFLGQHEITGWLRALKILRDDLKDNAEVLARFIQEARLAADTQHPNIARVYNIEERDGVWFMEIDYCEGGTLYDLIAKLGPQPAGVVVSIGCQLASAVRELHRRGIIHRDIKPDNVMLVRRGDDFVSPKLIDLGVAHLKELGSSDPTHERRVIGTRPYLSPAQLCGASVEATDDVFSLGVTLYELATGRLPWQKDGETSSDYYNLNDAALYQRQTMSRPVDPRRHIPTMLQGFAEALVWPLAMWPGDRPKDAREYVMALAREAPGRDFVLDGLQIVERYAPDLVRDEPGQHVVGGSTAHGGPIRRRRARPPWRGSLRRLPSALAARRFRAMLIAAGLVVVVVTWLVMEALWPPPG